MPRRYLPRGPMIEARGQLAREWEWFLRDLIHVPEWVAATEQRALRAALAATTLIVVPTITPPETPAPAGIDQTALYQVSYYARIVEAATVSSSLAVTITWVEQDVTQTYVAPAITDNTTTAIQNTTGLLVVADVGTTVTVETSYASVGADAMVYDLDVAVEPTSRIAISPTHALIRVD